MIFRKVPRNEKWETIRRRELRNDIVLGVVTLPAFYVWVVFMCACGV
jgi:hypothetical protein